MLFILIGLLESDLRAVPQAWQRQVSEFLGQSFINLKSAGTLHDRHGRLAGTIIMVECDDRAKADAILADNACLFADLDLFEYASDVSTL